MRRAEHVGDILRAFLRGAGLSQRIAQCEVVLAWPRVVGEEVARNSKAFDLKGGVLWVAVPSSNWRQHILFLKPQIIKAFAREFPQVPISDVRCVASARRGLERG